MKLSENEKEEGVPRQGRPPHSDFERFKALLKVARVMRHGNGAITYRAAVDLLHHEVPTRLIHESLGKLRDYYRAKKRDRMSRIRQSVAVEACGAVVAQDGTHLGRRDDGSALEGQVVRDVATLEVPAVSVGAPSTQAEVIGLLEALPERPLVWQTDNARIYTGRGVQEYLADRRIIHLVSRPGKPTDNAVIERGMREIKRYTGLGKGVVVRQAQNVAQLVARCIAWLNSTLKRWKFGVTSVQHAMTLPHWSEFVSRDVFYASTRKLLESTRRKDETLTQQRSRERRLIYSQLVRYGLVTLTRGGVPCRP